MNSPDVFTSENIDRAYKLISTPYVLAVLEGLGQGRTPAQAAGPDAEPSAVARAVEFLRGLGVADGNGGAVTLTGRGHRLLVGLEEICCHDDEYWQW